MAVRYVVLDQATVNHPSGVGPHKLVRGALNTYGNSANDAMVLHLPPPMSTEFGDVEIKERDNSSNNVTLTTVDSYPIENPQSPGNFATSVVLSTNARAARFAFVDGKWQVLSKCP